VTKFVGSVRIVGAGLLGTSIGLAMTKQGVDVSITSRSSKSVELAINYGAGRAATDSDSPTLIVVCVPPDQTAEIVSQELSKFPQAFVTDVASVKQSILHSLESLGAPIERYVGSHPMAGRERGGAMSGRADLFLGRPWIVCAHSKSLPAATKAVKDLASSLESSVVELSAKDHDRAVALVSHLPQLVASLLASRLIESDSKDVALAGQGLRDTTRIASSDPDLWMQIFSANADQVSEVLAAFAADLKEASTALGDLSKAENRATLRQVLSLGNTGVEKIPGKHGAKHSTYSQVVVMIDDEPGQLAKLLTDVGEIGINLEELKLEHSPSAQIGLVELYIAPSKEQKLITELEQRNWRLV
jgi:prephenate dehydrogenase